MSAWLWALVLVAALWVAHWGAEHLAHPLKKLRKQQGFSESAGAAFVGLAAASPEIGIAIVAALRGAADISLGASLGSNVIAIPLVVAVAYWVTRRKHLSGKKDDENQKKDGQEKKQDGKQERESEPHPVNTDARKLVVTPGRQDSHDEDKNQQAQQGEGDEQPQGQDEEENSPHWQHVKQGVVYVKPEAVMVLALPYLAILALFAALTLPAPWRGLQPIDGWILLGAYALFAAQALLRGRTKHQKVEWKGKEIWLAVAGVLALAVGAYFTVRATENIVAALGIQPIIGGLFITGVMAMMPELFAVRSVARSGQVTSAAASVLGDHAVTMTVAMFPLALIGLSIQNFQLFWVVLSFVALMPVLFAVFVPLGGKIPGFRLWQVLVFAGAVVAYVAVILFGVLRIFAGGPPPGPGVTAGEVLSAPQAYLNEELVVRGRVGAVLGVEAFTLVMPQAGGSAATGSTPAPGDPARELLVIRAEAAQPEPLATTFTPVFQGNEVQVAGTLTVFEIDPIEAVLGADLNDDLLARFEGQPALLSVVVQHSGLIPQQDGGSR